MKLLTIALAFVLLTGCEKPDDGIFRVLSRPGEASAALLAEFGKRPDVKLALETYASDEELLQKLSAQDAAYDLLEVDDRMARELAENGYLRPLNLMAIPNLANVDPAFTRPPFDVGEKYAAPYMAGFIGIVYNAEAVTLPIVSFKDVFHPQHAGRIVVNPDDRDITAAALFSQGLPLQALNDDKALSQITPLLANWLPKINPHAPRDPADALLQGEAVIGIVPSDDAAKLFSANPKFQWVLPAEGFRLFVNALVIPKTARHLETAEAAINFFLTPENGVALSKESPGYNPNLAARKLLSESELNNPASYPTGIHIANTTTFPVLGDQSVKIRALIVSLLSHPPKTAAP